MQEAAKQYLTDGTEQVEAGLLEQSKVYLQYANACYYLQVRCSAPAEGCYLFGCGCRATAGSKAACTLVFHLDFGWPAWLGMLGVAGPSGCHKNLFRVRCGVCCASGWLTLSQLGCHGGMLLPKSGWLAITEDAVPVEANVCLDNGLLTSQGPWPGSSCSHNHISLSGTHARACTVLCLWARQHSTVALMPHQGRIVWAVAFLPDVVVVADVDCWQTIALGLCYLRWYTTIIGHHMV